MSKMTVHVSYQHACLKKNNYQFVEEIILLSFNSLVQINFTANLYFSKFKSNHQQQELWEGQHTAMYMVLRKALSGLTRRWTDEGQTVSMFKQTNVSANGKYGADSTNNEPSSRNISQYRKCTLKKVPPTHAGSLRCDIPVVLVKSQN